MIGGMIPQQATPPSTAPAPTLIEESGGGGESGNHSSAPSLKSPRGASTSKHLGGGAGTEGSNVLSPRSHGVRARRSPLSAGASPFRARPNRDGSLLRLFQSEYFDIYYHMYYLYHRQEPGIQDYLVNLLYRRNEEDIHFYLPQLCCLCISRYKTSNLNKFILEKASKSMHLALKTSWLFQACCEDNQGPVSELAMQLNQEVEMAIVNSKPVPPGGSSYAPPLEVLVPDLFERRRAVNKLHTISKTPPANTAASPPATDAPPPDPTTCPPTPDLSTSDNVNIVHDHPTTSPPPSDAQLPPLNKPKLESQQKAPATSTQAGPPQAAPPQQKQRIAAGFVKQVGEIGIPGSRVKLPSVYSKLLSPLSHSSFRDSALMSRELQQFIVKQRRCDYYNLVNSFTSLIIDVSNKLATEPDRSLRLPLLQSFLKALNEWMFCRRCIVAASEGTFAMTGLNIPLSEFGSLSPIGTNTHSTQIVRFLPEECRVLSSRKRAPYLLVFEVADLDEDLRQLPGIFRLSTADFSKALTSPNREDACGSKTLLWNHLYVYNCLLRELIDRDLYKSTNHQRPSFNQIINQESPLVALRRSMGLRSRPKGTATSASRVATKAPPLSNETKPAEDSLSPSFSNDEAPAPLTSSVALPPPQSLPSEGDANTDDASSSVSAGGLHQPHPLPASAPPSLRSSTSTPPEDRDAQASAAAAGAVVDPAAAVADPNFDPDAGGQTPDKKENHVKEKGGGEAASGSTEPPHSSLTPPAVTRHSHPRRTENKGDEGSGVGSAVTDTSSDMVKRLVNAPAHSISGEMAVAARRVRERLWGDLWQSKKQLYRMSSPYGTLKSWNLGCVLVKGGDDVRQEMLASQLIKQFKCIFERANLPLYLRPYEILVTSANSGIMVFVPDTLSLDALKKKYEVDSIAKVFEAAFADNPYQAKKNFIESHAAYSIIGYLLQVKDRHNANYLLDAEGHIIHIDYGFMLNNSPGNVNFEFSPFKLTTEFLEVMDGELSENYEYFRTLVIRGFLEARKHSERLLLLVELMLSANKMPCFGGSPETAFAQMKERFMLNSTEEMCIQKVAELIDISANNWWTIQYDKFQRLTNGIL